VTVIGDAFHPVHSGLLYLRRPEWQRHLPNDLSEARLPCYYYECGSKQG